MLLLAEDVKELEVISRATLTSVHLVPSERGDIEVFVMEARYLGNPYKHSAQKVKYDFHPRLIVDPMIVFFILLKLILYIY